MKHSVWKMVKERSHGSVIAYCSFTRWYWSECHYAKRHLQLRASKYKAILSVLPLVNTYLWIEYFEICGIPSLLPLSAERLNIQIKQTKKKTHQLSWSSIFPNLNFPSLSSNHKYSTERNNREKLIKWLYFNHKIFFPWHYELKECGSSSL